MSKCIYILWVQNTFCHTGWMLVKTFICHLWKDFLYHLYQDFFITGPIPWRWHLGPRWASLPQVVASTSKSFHPLYDLWSLISYLWYLISQRWEDCKNKLNEKHLLKPADPQEALCVLDISQSVGEVIFKCYNSTDNYCPGSRRHWDRQVLRQQHRLVVEVSPKANHSLPDSSTPSQGRCHCSLCRAQKNEWRRQLLQAKQSNIVGSPRSDKVALIYIFIFIYKFDGHKYWKSSFLSW